MITCWSWYKYADLLLHQSKKLPPNLETLRYLFPRHYIPLSSPNSQGPPLPPPSLSWCPCPPLPHGENLEHCLRPSNKFFTISRRLENQAFNSHARKLPTVHTVHCAQWVVCTYTDKKENQIFLIYTEMQSVAVAKSYMRKGFLIYEEMGNYFPIYQEAVSHIWLCNCSIMNFLIYEENVNYFYQCIL